MDDQDVWKAVSERRYAIADLLSEVGPDAWEHPSLCDGWTVGHVAAHLTMPLLGLHELVLLAVRHRGRTNRLICEGSIAMERRYGRDEVLRRLRRLAGMNRHVPGLGCREALIDAIGHEQDIALPLGLTVVPPPHHVAEAADRVLALAGRTGSRVFRQLPLDGVRLAATDHDWSAGAGPDVTATMLDLYLLLIGRTAHLDTLTGPGAELVIARIRG